ncbi:hypothetical protein BSCG_05159 [Bacteroides sp. 2_2_4]|nr:hypothetical protein BSCG_05159 [Bacteroides sp. 2_2_4]
MNFATVVFIKAIQRNSHFLFLFKYYIETNTYLSKYWIKSYALKFNSRAKKDK